MGVESMIQLKEKMSQLEDWFCASGLLKENCHF